jgi:D-xylose transport system permease protein
MKAFEGGSHNGFWFILILGLVMLVYGLYSGLRGRAADQPLRPATLGLVVGGVFFAYIAWASGGTLPIRNPVIYLALFTGVVWFTLRFTKIGRPVYAVGGNADAARREEVSLGTAKTQLQRIYDKVGVRSQPALVRALLEVG